MPFSFGDEISLFAQSVESLEGTIPLFAHMIETMMKQFGGEYNKFLADHGTEADGSEDEKKSFNIPYDKLSAFRRVQRRIDHVEIANKILPHTAILALISQFDNYIGRLIHGLFELQPQKLLASEKNLSFAELQQFQSIEAAKDHILEKEIEGVLRENHAEQFRWLERKLDDTPLTKGLDVWPEFIELTQRRNLFAHCGGVVTRQYIKICKDHKVNFVQEPVIGAVLPPEPAYVQNAHRVIYEIGVKLGHVMWRKLKPDDLLEADSALNGLCVDLIVFKKHALAEKLLEFATGVLKKHGSEQTRLMLRVNLAQTYKWQGKKEKCEAIVSKIDWTPLGDDFQIAMRALTDDIPGLEHFHF